MQYYELYDRITLINEDKCLIASITIKASLVQEARRQLSSYSDLVLYSLKVKSVKEFIYFHSIFFLILPIVFVI